MLTLLPRIFIVFIACSRHLSTPTPLTPDKERVLIPLVRWNDKRMTTTPASEKTTPALKSGEFLVTTTLLKNITHLSPLWKPARTSTLINNRQQQRRAIPEQATRKYSSAVWLYYDKIVNYIRHHCQDGDNHAKTPRPEPFNFTAHTEPLTSDDKHALDVIYYMGFKKECDQPKRSAVDNKPPHPAVLQYFEKAEAHINYHCRKQGAAPALPPFNFSSANLTEMTDEDIQLIDLIDESISTYCNLPAPSKTTSLVNNGQRQRRAIPEQATRKYSPAVWLYYDKIVNYIRRHCQNGDNHAKTPRPEPFNFTAHTEPLTSDDKHTLEIIYHMGLKKECDQPKLGIDAILHPAVWQYFWKAEAHIHFNCRKPGTGETFNSFDFAAYPGQLTEQDTDTIYLINRNLSRQCRP